MSAGDLQIRPPAAPGHSGAPSAPVGAEQALTARILEAQGRAIIVAALLTFAAGTLVLGMSLRLLLLAVLLAVIGLGTILIVRRGHITAGAYLLITSVWALATLAAWTGGGLEAPIIGVQLVVVVLAGLLLDWRASMVAAATAGAVVLFLAWAEAAGRLPASSAPATQWWQATVLTVVVVLMTQAVAIAVWNRQRSSANALRELERRAAAEAELAESRATLSAVIEGASDLVFITDLDGRYRFINRAAADALDAPVEEIVGRDVTTILPPQQAELVAAANEEVLRTGRPVTREQLMTLGRAPRWYLVTRGPLTLADGSVIGVYSISRDITESKLTRDRRRATLNSLLDPHVLVQAVRDEAGHIVDFLYLEANAAAAQSMGRERDQLVGARLRAVLPTETDSELVGLWVATVDSGHPLIIDDFVLYNALLDQHRFYDLRGLRVGDGLSFTWRDVSERHEMEAALRRRIDELDALQRISTLLAGSSDLPQALHEVSRQVGELFAATCTQIRILPEAAAPGAAALQTVAATGACGDGREGPPEPVVGEALRTGQPVTGDAGPGRGHVLAVPMVSGPVIVGLLSVVRAQDSEFGERQIKAAQPIADALAAAIENQRLHEHALRQAAEDERRRIARSLHDAVTQTINAANVVAEAMPSIWERSHEEGLRELDTLRRLVQAALAEMRILLFELRPGTLEVTPLDALLARLAEALEGHAAIDIELNVVPELELPHEVKLALYHIAQEALSNVAAHAHAGEVTVRVTSDEKVVRLTVRDDGEGFALSARPDRPGLRTMRASAAAIGATLAVDSVPERGTTVTAVWPRPAPGDPAAFAPADTPSA